MVQRHSSCVRRVRTGRRLLLVAFTAIVGLVGCGPEPSSPELTNPNEQVFPWMKTTTATHGHFYATARRGGAGDVHFTSGGHLYTSTGHSASANGGTIIASDLQIPIGSHGEYWSIGAPTYGNTSTWGLTGNSLLGIPAFTDQMYVPAVIGMTSPATPAVTSVSKSGTTTVTWNADPNNTNVVVYYSYDYVTSQFADSTKPTADIGQYWLVPDNGSFTIPAGAFISVPTNGYIRLGVARGAGKVTGTSTHKFHIYASTSADGIFKMLP